jgi:hypothetical protein
MVPHYHHAQFLLVEMESCKLFALAGLQIFVSQIAMIIGVNQWAGFHVSLTVVNLPSSSLPQFPHV